MNGSEPTQLETVVSELQSVTRGTYGQYCGLSRAAEMIGERWGLLILRDLLVSPKTAAELHGGLPRISARLLAMRLKELEYSGVVRRQDDTQDPDEAVFELTEYGQAVEDVLLALGRWGAIALAAPRPEDIITEDSLTVALRATFLADAARADKISYELHVGETVVHAVIDNGSLEVSPGPLAGADAVIDSGPLLKSMLTGEVTAAEALNSGQVTMTGEPELLTRFVELFQLPKLPTPVAA
ncbi:helix-turn-helix domain-containing protein [Actinophytocola sp.]|uniref:winged helix-turn-helix transcriptional regulator n=1 Tax=Actinophytocola sp. TaxID=1872138 RepID=UPI0025C0C382|nr:helix-turn-helix domain-containing protein [Actinophytocola sp.]